MQQSPSYETPGLFRTDMTGPRDVQALPGAAEVRGHLFGPLERRIERP
jgi:hypothetical protein